jgi:tRNA pseudouridine38-40 synthase
METADRASFQLVLHYDGGAFAGWQRQPGTRTVQGELERALHAVCGEPTAALGSGRTDAGVHARGQAVGVRVAPRWTAERLRRAVNAHLPADVWVADAFAMTPAFHARFSAERRRYAYHVGTDALAMSPFRRDREWPLGRALPLSVLSAEAAALPGTHTFRAFAIAKTAPADDDHRCAIHRAEWEEHDGRVVFHIEANRFLHHMVRFLVGTMVEVALGRRPAGTIATLLEAADNRGTPRPAPPQGLFLEQVTYPPTLYLSPT